MIGYSEQQFCEQKKFVLVTPKRQKFMSKDEVIKKYKNKDGLEKQLNQLLESRISSFNGNNKLTIRLASDEELKKEYERMLAEDGSRAEIRAYREYHEYDHVAPTLRKYGNVYVSVVDDRVTKQVETICGSDEYSIRPVEDNMGYIVTIPSQYVETPVEMLSEDTEPMTDETEEEDIDEKYMDDIEDIEEYENVVNIDDIEDFGDDIIDNMEDVEEYEEEDMEDITEEDVEEEEDYYEE